MPTTPQDTRLTYQDFLLFPDDGLRHEIIDGEHYVTPSPNLRHQELVLRLGMSIGLHVEDHPERGRVFIAPFDPELNVVSIYRRHAEGSFPLIASPSATGHDTLETPLLPGWAVELSRLFR